MHSLQLDYAEYYNPKKRNIKLEISKTPNKFTLDELRIVYEEMTGVYLELPTREVFIYLILRRSGISTFKSGISKAEVCEYGRILDLFLDHTIVCTDPEQELVAAYIWLFRSYPNNISFGFMRKKITCKLAEFESNTK
jgi:hypothetical protein